MIQMAENDKEILSYARKIRKYCNSRRCDDCVFFKDGFCVLADSDGNPCDWVIPKPRKAGDYR